MFKSIGNLWIRKMFLLMLTLGELQMTHTSEDTRVFTKTPGHVRVMEKTTALLDWRHSIKNPESNAVVISWFDIGTVQQKTVTLIMTYTSDYGVSIASSDKSTRLSYIQGEDSAAMELDWATESDDGLYEVRVMDPKDPIQGGFYIRDVATLEVVKWPNVRFTVTVRNQTFHLNAAQDGSSFFLPSASVSMHDRVYVKIANDDSAPPSDIKMMTSGQQELPCDRVHLCERNIPIMIQDEKVEHGSIDVSLDFGVQNLAVVHVTIPLDIENVHVQKSVTRENSSPNVVAITLGVIFCTVIIAALVICLVLMYKRKFWKSHARDPVTQKVYALDAMPQSIDMIENEQTNKCIVKLVTMREQEIQNGYKSHTNSNEKQPMRPDNDSAVDLG